MPKSGRDPESHEVGPSREHQEIGLLILTERGRIRRALQELLASDTALEEAITEIRTRMSPVRSLSRDGALPGRSFRRRLPVRRSGGVTLFLRMEEIDRLEAANQYVEIHIGGKKYLIRESMRSMEKCLDPRLFQRIHRSTIVNLERVRELRSVSSVDRWVGLSDGSRHRVSQRYWNPLRRALIDAG